MTITLTPGTFLPDTFLPGTFLPGTLGPGVTTRIAARCSEGHGPGARRR
jgi:hypothetical protein